MTTQNDELMAASPGGEALFDMANLRPDRTGLPCIVWISAKGHARHDARVKVAYPLRVQEFVASVSLRPDVRVVAGDMPADDFAALTRWVALNRETLLAYWDGAILYTEDAVAALRPLEES